MLKKVLYLMFVFMFIDSGIKKENVVFILKSINILIIW